jgi:hypothetical protein
MFLGLLHVGHSLLHGLQYLSLHYQDLIKCGWWRRIGSIVVIVVIVLVCDTVASVCHLVIMKRFETKIELEIEIEIKDSQLYVSRYKDD